MYLSEGPLHSRFFQNRRSPPHFDFPPFYLCEIICLLKREPALRGSAKCFFQPYGHFRRNSGLTIQDPRQHVPGNPQYLGSISHRQSQGFETIPPDRATRMRWIVRSIGHCVRSS